MILNQSESNQIHVQPPRLNVERLAQESYRDGEVRSFKVRAGHQWRNAAGWW